jgi:hypothetical protein
MLKISIKFHLPATCPPPVRHLSATCPPPVRHLSATCPPPVYHLSTTCPPPVRQAVRVRLSVPAQAFLEFPLRFFGYSRQPKTTFRCQVPRQAVQGSKGSTLSSASRSTLVRNFFPPGCPFPPSLPGVKRVNPPFFGFRSTLVRTFPARLSLILGEKKKVCRYVGRWLVFEKYFCIFKYFLFIYFYFFI